MTFRWGKSFQQYCFLAITLPLLALCATCAQASLIGAQVRLSADALRIPADGATAVALSIEVLDGSGLPVPDGTLVNLTATLGEIISPVQTLGGYAQTVLKPSSVAGTSIVSAMVGATRAMLEIEFLAVPGSAAAGSGAVELTADELSYSPDRRLFFGGTGSRVVCDDLEIRAEALQYDVMSNTVCAQGEVVLKSGKQELTAEALRYELTGLRGRLIRISGENAERLLVEGQGLTTREDTGENTALWASISTGEVRTWLKARRAVVQPRQKVILDHADFYVDDLHIMGLRRQVLDPRRGGNALFGSGVGYSTLFGAALDLPFTYRASATQIGSLHLKRTTAVGNGTGGWALGVVEEYLKTGKAEGRLSLDNIFNPSRGLSVRHQLKFGTSSALTLDAATSRYTGGDTSLQSAGLSFYRPMAGGKISLNLSGSTYGDSESYFGSVSYRFRTSTLSSGVLLTPVVSLKQSRRHMETTQVLVDPATGETVELRADASGSTTAPSCDLDISLPRRLLKNGIELSGSLHTGYTMKLGGEGRMLFDSRFRAMRRLSPQGLVTLDYIYNGAPSSLQESLFTLARQRLSLTGQGTLKGWAIRLNASKDIGGDRQFGSLSLSRGLPWGRDASGQSRWSFNLAHTLTRFAQYGLASTRLSLDRRFGQYGVSFCFSPQGRGGIESQPWISLDGYGYTYSGGRRFWIEMNAAGFNF